jgi:hypothetical protein
MMEFKINLNAVVINCRTNRSNVARAIQTSMPAGLGRPDASVAVLANSREGVVFDIGNSALWATRREAK